ncbi:uncharacterized protein LOC102800528 [Saccoglossus kowalevskii]
MAMYCVITLIFLTSVHLTAGQPSAQFGDGDDLKWAKLGDDLVSLINTWQERQMSLRKRLDLLSDKTQRGGNDKYILKKEVDSFLRSLSKRKIHRKKGWGWLAEAAGDVTDAFIDIGEVVAEHFNEVLYQEPIRTLAEVADDIIDFFDNVYVDLWYFMTDIYDDLKYCFYNAVDCLNNAFENIIEPVMELMKNEVFELLANGFGVGGPIAVWQGMAHQVRIGNENKCLGYHGDGNGSYSLGVEECFDPSSSLKSNYSQDFILTPCDNCHDTRISFLNLIDVQLRMCNVGDFTTGRDWMIMVEVSSIGHVIFRGLVAKEYGNTATFSAEVTSGIFPIAIFTRTVKIEGHVKLWVDGGVYFVIESAVTNPSVPFLDAILSAFEMSFIVSTVDVLDINTNTGGFQNYYSGYGQKK